MTPEEKFEVQRSQFIQELLKLLPFGDWNEFLLTEAETKCGFNKGYHHIIFPGEVHEIITYLSAHQDQQMLFELQSIQTPAKVREKVALALMTRLKLNSKIVHLRNSAYFALPQNISTGVQLAWRTCDLIWRYAGDDSTDFNHYSKRGLLLSAYLPSIMFYISDESENDVETEKFIESALANIINFANLKNQIKFPKMEDIPFIRLFT